VRAALPVSRVKDGKTTMARTKRPVTPVVQPDPAASQAPGAQQVVGGVDTHKDTHTAAVIDTAGRMLGHATFPAAGAGYVQLLDWLTSFGRLLLVGIEGTGVYGSGLAAHLRAHGVAMVEVDRPDRKARRWQGKSDPVDAEAAARAALAARATGPPRTATVRWRPCGCCGWPAAARSTSAPPCSARSRP
jgi:hypothetical protein